MSRTNRFSPRLHIPHYSALILRCIRTPILIYFALAGNVITFLGAYVFYYFEVTANSLINTYWDAVWFAFCTVTTVGYGDIIPVTQEGRLTAIIMMVTGIMIFFAFSAVLVSLVTAYTTQELFEEGAEDKSKKELAPIRRELMRIERELKNIASED